MSTANKANDTYLQHVSLKNYKSIKDVEIDFKPGLNIIIGKNASGKTNFINGLSEILNFQDEPFSDSENKLNANFKNNKIEIQTLNKNETKVDVLSDEYYNFPLSQEVLLKINDEQIEISNHDDLKSTLFEKDIFFKKILIKYGIYYNDKARFINVPFSFVLINNERVSRDLMTVVADDNKTEFIQSFFYLLYIDIVSTFQNKVKNELTIENIKNEIIFLSEQRFRHINNLINKFSPIRSIRVNPDFNIIKEDGQKQTITNFYLEFLIDQNWLSFNLLSDGTKRLFYIISEVLFLNPPSLIKSNDLDIILLEEPELGIHPHQLHLLMQFIREESKEKQIIITTHSPQVLDSLEPDQLDRVIICHYDSNKGTQLSHLSEKEIKKAKKYIQEEAFLSDYWRFSDLEPAS